jgi:hypothetical protein
MQRNEAAELQTVAILMDLNVPDSFWDLCT